MADLNAEQVVYRGKLVASFLASEAWSEVGEAVERRAFAEFKASDGAPDGLVKLWQRLHALEAVKREFRVIRDRANLAEPDKE